MDREEIIYQLGQSVYETVNYLEEEYGVIVTDFHCSWDETHCSVFSLNYKEE